MAAKINRIAGITVGGFKSICTEQHIEIEPLTILAGANSSGKSSIMQPLLLLKQTLETPSDPGALLLDGPNVKFTLSDQLLARLPGRKCSDSFTVGINLQNDQSLTLVFRPQLRKGFEVTKMIYEADRESFQIVPKMAHEDIEKIIPDRIRSYYDFFKRREKTTLRWAVYRDHCFLSFELIKNREARQIASRRYTTMSPGRDFVSYIEGIIHLPGLRGNPQRTYPIRAGGPNFQGTFEPYVASVINQWQTEHSEKMGDLGKTLEDMGLTWKVQSKAIDDTQVELKVGRLMHSKQGGAKDLVSIADVGFGVSQSLPVIVALLAAQPGQLVYLEQPEIHLHPLAQRRLANVLRDSIERGVVAVVETHSALLIRELQTLVATEQISREDIALHWFQRGEDGSTTITTANLDDQGAYGDWPEDFDRTELEAEKAYLDAVEFRERRK